MNARMNGWMNEWMDLRHPAFSTTIIINTRLSMLHRPHSCPLLLHRSFLARLRRNATKRMKKSACERAHEKECVRKSARGRKNEKA
jgi:hypothetical protein